MDLSSYSSYISLITYIYIYLKSLSIFGKEAHGLSHTQSCLKYQDSKKIIDNKMASHHTHDQNMTHTELCCHWQGKPELRSGLAAAVCVQDNEHWSGSPPGGVPGERRGSGLILF